jgi:hypothetical protein
MSVSRSEGRGTPTPRPARSARSGDVTSAPGAAGTGRVVAVVALAIGLSWGVGAALAGLPVLSDGVFIAGVPLAAVLVTTEGRAGMRDLAGRGRSLFIQTSAPSPRAKTSQPTKCSVRDEEVARALRRAMSNM